MFGELNYGGMSQFGGADMFGGNDWAASQDESKTPNKVGRKSVVQKRENDPGCFPLTISMIFNGCKCGEIKSGKCTMHGLTFGVAEVVGWVLAITKNVGVTEMRMSDGTGAITTLLESRADDEEWFGQLVENIKVGDLVRVVGTINPESPPQLSALHFRTATAAEFTYHHTISIIYVALKAAEETGNDIPIAKNENVNTDVMNCKSVSLPDDYDPDVTDICERHAVRYILDNRQPNVGVSRSAIKGSLQSKFKNGEVEAAVDSLLEKGLLIQTIEGYCDGVF